MMRIAMLIAGSAAGLIWCITASAQQSGDTLASANRMASAVDLGTTSPGTTRPVTEDSRTVIPASAPDPATSRRVWLIAPADKTLQATLSGWSATVGWQLQWDLPVDYPVEIHATISGTFEEAVETITRTMEYADVPMKAIFYMGNKVLRIAAKGGE